MKSRKRKFVPSSHPGPFALVASPGKSKTKVGTLACFDFCERMTDWNSSHHGQHKTPLGSPRKNFILELERSSLNSAGRFRAYQYLVVSYTNPANQAPGDQTGHA